MRKEIPHRTVTELLVPNADYDYFAHWQQQPFDPEATDFDAANAWWLAEAAFLAFGNEELIRAKFTQAGLAPQRFTIKILRVGVTQCFIAHDDRSVILVFRGTQIDNLWGALVDTAADLTFLPVAEPSGSWVHKGFYETLSTIWPQILDYIANIPQSSAVQRRLWLTGHSLGGAMATLAATAALREPNLPPLQGVYTYGSPRVGGTSFRDYYVRQGLHDKTQRIVNNQDVVTRLPPTSLQYVHVGKLRYIDKAGSLLVDADAAVAADDFDVFPGFDEIKKQFYTVRTWQSALKSLVPNWIADHAPISYACHLWNHLDAQTRKTGETP